MTISNAEEGGPKAILQRAALSFNLKLKLTGERVIPLKEPRSLFQGTLLFYNL